MNTAQRNLARTTLAFLTAVALGAPLVGGCGLAAQRDDIPSQDRTPGDELGSQSANHPEEAKTSPTARNSDPLRSLCRRVCASVGEQIESHQRRLVRHGLIPPRQWDLEVRVDPAAETCPRKLLLAQRVREALPQALSAIDGISLAGPQSGGHGEPMRLDVNITTDFGTGVFDEVQCEFISTLGENRHVYRDSFEIDQGLVRIKALGGNDTLLVSAIRTDGDAVDLETAPDKWFLMRRGRYERITVRSRTSVWAAPLVVGVQNLWDMSKPPIGDMAPHQAPGGSPVLPHHPATNEERERPQVAILSPADGADVGRALTVSGVVTGQTASRFEGSRVDVAIVSDMEYWQDGHGTVKNRTWHVPCCYVGRVGREDNGKVFYIRARLQSGDGCVESETIRVVRR